MEDDWLESAFEDRTGADDEEWLEDEYEDDRFPVWALSVVRDEGSIVVFECQHHDDDEIVLVAVDHRLAQDIVDHIQRRNEGLEEELPTLWVEDFQVVG